MHKNAFGKKEIISVLEKLKNGGYLAFCDEAHFQMSFIKACYDLKLFKRYEFIPEFPVDIQRNWYIKTENKYIKKTEQRSERGSIDLVVVNKRSKSKTLIEFKYLTSNNGKLGNQTNYIIKNPCPFIEKIEPSNMQANDQRRFDCWSDIERMEYLIGKKEADLGFLIVVTNDKSYWEDDGTHPLLTLKENKDGEFYGPQIKEWNCDENDLINKEGSFCKNRMRKIVISQKYEFHYKKYSSIDTEKNVLEFKSLIIEVTGL